MTRCSLDLSTIYPECGACGDEVALPASVADGHRCSCATCGAQLETDTDSDDGRGWVITREVE